LIRCIFGPGEDSADSILGGSVLRRISGKCFADREIRLDGFDYVDCSFYSCRFVYSGRKNFSLTGNLVSSDCVLVLRDRAADTISALCELYDLGDWGRNRVMATLSQITTLAGAARISLH
jgi:hypothetical protein